MGIIDDRSLIAEIEDCYRRHGVGLVRFATVLVGPDDAQDVVSSAVLRVLDKSRGGIESPKAYLYQAVANQARNHKRGEARRRQRDSRVASQDEVTLLPEAYPEVRRAVEELSVRQRAVVYLTYWEDLNESAVAEHLGISAGSVRSHLARARRHLRRGLQEHE